MRKKEKGELKVMQRIVHTIVDEDIDYLYLDILISEGSSIIVKIPKDNYNALVFDQSVVLVGG